MKFNRLFTPLEVKPGFVLKNRLVMPAMHHLYTDRGSCTPRFSEYYWRRAEGGLAMVIVGSCRFDGYGAKDNSMSLRTNDTIPGWRAFTEGMHQRDCKVAVQLYHAGRYMPARDVPCGKPALAPSAVYSSYTRETAPEMTKFQMEEVVANWAAAAVRAQEAGFDAVEILGSAGYLLSQFLSPVTNQRKDEYGGSWENRCRFPLEVIRAVRAAVGAEYPILFRLGGKDFIPGSNETADACAFAALAEEAGVDLFNVTGGWHETKVPQLTGEVPRGCYTYLSQAVKQAVSVPVMMCNRINDPTVAEETLALGRADVIGMGRAMVADPDFALKARLGRAAEIRPCVACNQGCLANTFFDKPVRCLVNGLCGLEWSHKEVRAAKPKRILVVGGGPAGCECAVRAAGRGHKVTLWEREDHLGGQLRLAARAPGNEEFSALLAYYEAALKKKKVKVVYRQVGTPMAILAEDVDEVVLATGGIPNYLRLPVSETDVTICSAAQVLRDEVVAGRNVAVLGGSFVGCAAAHYLARKGSVSAEQLYFLAAYGGEPMDRLEEMLHQCSRKVTVVEQGPKVGCGYEPGTSWPVLQDLSRLGAELWKQSKVVDVHMGGVTVERTGRDGEIATVELPCDTLVVASGVHPDDSLEKALLARGVSARRIGNCRALGKAIDAISAGALLFL
ncbi:MAG: FAD-dependent oxidoreductase [Oscillospiraceae bacterium]|nr:FAD-dependent oxidoreductase [Oscillospiraceae bacterium]